MHCGNGQFVFNEAFELDFRLAAADRSSFPEAVAGLVGMRNGGAGVRMLRFHEDYCVPRHLISAGTVS